MQLFLIINSREAESIESISRKLMGTTDLTWAGWRVKKGQEKRLWQRTRESLTFLWISEASQAWAF